MHQVVHPAPSFLIFSHPAALASSVANSLIFPTPVSPFEKGGLRGIFYPLTLAALVSSAACPVVFPTTPKGK